jgi:hypothetical protein
MNRSRHSLERQFRRELNLARRLWPNQIGHLQTKSLKLLCAQYGLTLAAGDVLLLDGRWYVTHAGLLRISERRGCSGIRTTVEKQWSDPVAGRWVFKSVVYKSARSRGFVGYGDADHSNVSPLMHGAEMRVAETRAVNRALRKAYGIGLCSVEELGWTPKPSATQSSHNGSSARAPNRSHSAPPRLRDRLCLLIREHQLDPTLVKLYAADYCGTPALHNASREQVETFINHLTERATNDRAALLCHLNSFAKAPEVSS